MFWGAGGYGLCRWRGEVDRVSLPTARHTMGEWQQELPAFKKTRIGWQDDALEWMRVSLIDPGAWRKLQTCMLQGMELLQEAQDAEAGEGCLCATPVQRRTGADTADAVAGGNLLDKTTLETQAKWPATRLVAGEARSEELAGMAVALLEHVIKYRAMLEHHMEIQGEEDVGAEDGAEHWAFRIEKLKLLAEFEQTGTLALFLQTMQETLSA